MVATGKFVSTEVEVTERSHVLGVAPSRPELERLIAEAISSGVTDEELREQRVSFAYGNAPESARIPKESVRDASRMMRMVHP